ncbi:MAG TPA: PqqD family protein [Firmicutes bacterium]|nr:PqqD family protein [Bacillota bacterium]
MRLKDNLVLRKVAGQFVIVPVGKRVQEIPNTVYISSSAAFLWDYMKENEFTEEILTDKIMEHYTGVTRETVQEDIRQFLDVLRKNRILEKEPGESEPEGGTVRVVIRK